MRKVDNEWLGYKYVDGQFFNSYVTYMFPHK